MKRRILLGLLAVLLAVGCFGTVRTALADDTVYTEGTLYYVVENESIKITGCFGRDEEVTVPAMIAGIPVNTIGTGAFWTNQYVKTLKLPDTISKIEKDAIRADIYVIYNANTDHPQDYPTDLILSNVDPDPNATPEATEEPSEQPTEQATEPPTPEPTKEPETTPSDGGQQGSGSGDIDDTPTPTPTPKPTEAPTDTPPVDIGEVDIDLTETEEPTEEPTAAPTDTPEPTTAAPVAEASEKPASTAEPTPDPGKPIEPEQPKKNGWIWAPIGVAAAGGVAGLIAVLSKAKKRKQN